MRYEGATLSREHDGKVDFFREIELQSVSFSVRILSFENSIAVFVMDVVFSSSVLSCCCPGPPTSRLLEYCRAGDTSHVSDVSV